MLTLPGSVRIVLATQPVDMRNSIDGLMALVRTGWGEDVYSGHLFVFVSRKGDRVKILTFSRGGFVLYYKRLETGRFRLPPVEAQAQAVPLDATQLTMLLDGCGARGAPACLDSWPPAVWRGYPGEVTGAVGY